MFTSLAGEIIFPQIEQTLSSGRRVHTEIYVLNLCASLMTAVQRFSRIDIISCDVCVSSYKRREGIQLQTVTMLFVYGRLCFNVE